MIEEIEKELIEIDNKFKEKSTNIKFSDIDTYKGIGKKMFSTLMVSTAMTIIGEIALTDVITTTLGATAGGAVGGPIGIGIGFAVGITISLTRLLIHVLRKEKRYEDGLIIYKQNVDEKLLESENNCFEDLELLEKEFINKLNRRLTAIHIEIVNIDKEELIDEGPKIVELVAEDGKMYYTEAILRIEKLGIEYPVLSDTSDALLKISLNKFHGPNPNDIGNYCIAGHNYKSGKMFGNLKMIQIDDTFTLEDLYGRVFTYKVYDKYLVSPTDTACTTQRTGGKREVTLITCQNSGKERLIVRAREI